MVIPLYANQDLTPMLVRIMVWVSGLRLWLGLGLWHNYVDKSMTVFRISIFFNVSDFEPRITLK